MKKYKPARSGRNKAAIDHSSLSNHSSLGALAAAAFVMAISGASVPWAKAAERANPPAAKKQGEQVPNKKPPSAGAAVRPAETLSLSDAQRKTAWHDLYMESLNQNAPAGFDAVVGAAVPNTIVIVPVTAQAGGDVPALKPYSFAMVQKKLVIVESSNRKIAGVIAP